MLLYVVSDSQRSVYVWNKDEPSRYRTWKAWHAAASLLRTNDCPVNTNHTHTQRESVK